MFDENNFATLVAQKYKPKKAILCSQTAQILKLQPKYFSKKKNKNFI